MENKNDENLDNAPQSYPTGDTPAGPALAGESENNETSDPSDQTDKDDPGAASDPDTGTATPSSGPSDESSGSTDGESTDNPDKESPDNPHRGSTDNPGGERRGEYEARFLNSGIMSDSADPVKRRDSLAATLIRTALAILTGEIPPDSLIALTEAALAREEIMKAHAETEKARTRIEEVRTEIEKARAEGEILGRNAVIEEQLIVPPVGAPDLSGAPIARSRRAAASIFDLARLAR